MIFLHFVIIIICISCLIGGGFVRISEYRKYITRTVFSQQMAECVVLG